MTTGSEMLEGRQATSASCQQNDDPSHRADDLHDPASYWGWGGHRRSGGEVPSPSRRLSGNGKEGEEGADR